MRRTLAASLVGVAAADHWAVIMAGSNTYGNYRHQADACHAYQIAKKNGIPESNIILLAYDDIANNNRNPFPGQIFNKPDGPDVYAGCKISYRGKDVNKDTFLKVLKGDTSANGPVLRSTKTDSVFVYYADHGGVGILGVPYGAAGGYIHASDVNNALDTLHSKGGFKELLFYIEACESGSIFQNQLKTPNVFAVTAANAHESSWGFYCGSAATVHGKNIGSCLGDEFSIRWMEDADVANFKSESVNQQVSKVTSEVTKSHVSKFGDSSHIGGEVIGDFEGAEVSRTMSVSLAKPLDFSNSAVNSRDIEVHDAYEGLRQAETIAERRDAEKALASVLAKRAAVDEKFTKIATVAMNGDKEKAQAMIDGSVDSLNFDCHVQTLEIAAKRCGAFNDYSMRHSRLFANLCESVPVAQIETAVKQVCGGEVVV